MEYLTLEDLVDVATAVTGGAPLVRDYGLLGSAAHRPQEYVFGHEVYPTLHQKAAALLEAIVRYHPLLDGNKRLGWASMRTSYDLNGYTIEAPPTSEVVDFMLAVAVEKLDITQIAKRLESWARPRP